MSEVTPPRSMEVQTEIQKTSWHPVILGYLSLLALGFIDNLRGPYFPGLLRDLTLSDSQGGLFFSTTSAIAFLASWFAKNLIARCGFIRVLAMGVFVTAGSSLFISRADSLVELLFASACFGLGFGAISVAMNVAVSEGVSLEWRHRALSGLHAVYGLASFVSPFWVTFLAMQEKSWREGFAWGALIPVVVGCYALYLALNKKAIIRKAQGSSVQTEVLKGKKKLIVLWMAFSVAIYLFGEISLSTRLVLHLVRTYEWSLEHSSIYLSAFFACLFFSRLGFLLFKVPLQIFSLVHLCLWGSIILFSAGLLIHPLFLSACGLTMGPFVPAALDHLMRLFGHYRNQALSYTMAFFSLVIICLQMLLGVLTEQYSIALALWCGPLGMLISWLMYIGGAKKVMKERF